MYKRQTVSNSELSDGEKLDRFSESFNKLTQVTIDMVVHGIVQIQVDDQVVVDQDHIMEFITKGDKDFYAGITAHMEAQKKKYDVEPFKVETTAEEQEAGAPKTFDVPITFDQSNFFG